MCGKGGWGSGEIETGLIRCSIWTLIPSGKGGWGSGEIETRVKSGDSERPASWKGWMGLRRD